MPTKRTRCRLCDSTDLEVAIPVNPMPLVDGYTTLPNHHEPMPCDVYYCHGCGHAQLLDIIDPALIFKDYLFRTGSNLSLVAHYRHYADWLAREFDTAFVVEIGCNDGTLLDMLPVKSRKLGIDPSNVKCSHPRHKQFMSMALAEQILREDGAPTLIIANHVFAHADDLNAMLAAIRRLMAADTVFIFEVAYAQDMLDKCLYDQIEHEHLSYHSIGALIPFLNRHGMALTAYSRNDCKGGSLRCVAHIGAQPHIEYTEDCTLSRYRDMADEITARREALHLALNGRRCIGYGAAAPCTSVMYQMGLQNKIKMLVDDNPDRYALHSPHANIHVLRPSAIYDYQNPIVILAPRYSKEIMAKHPDIADHFIVP